MKTRNIQQEVSEMLEELRIKKEKKRKADRRGPPSFKSIRNDYKNLKKSYDENKVWQMK